MIVCCEEGGKGSAGALKRSSLHEELLPPKHAFPLDGSMEAAIAVPLRSGRWLSGKAMVKSASGSQTNLYT